MLTRRIERSVPTTPRRPGRAVSAAIAVVAAACHGKATRRPPPAVPVRVEAARVADVPVDLTAIGSVTPVDTVAVTSRVDGRLDRVLVHEGDRVRRGQLLFVLDPRPFEATLAQARAALRRDLATADYDRREAARYSLLVRRQLVSAEQYGQYAAAAQAAAATVGVDRAAVRAARVNLGYTEIHAPIDGLAGNLQITLGNEIKANDTTPMVVLRRIQPIDVAFSVPGDALPSIRTALTRGARSSIREEVGGGRRALAANATWPGRRGPAAGRLYFVANTIDPATGTLLLKARFANPDMALWPGQFVTVDLRLGLQRNAVVVPERAVQIGQQGKYAFVVRPDGTAEMRPLVTGPRYRDLVAVERGVRAGERVVTDGQLGLVTGTRVDILTPPASTPSSAPAVELAPPAAP